MKQTAHRHSLVIFHVLCPLKQRTPVRNVSTDKELRYDHSIVPVILLSVSSFCLYFLSLSAVLQFFHIVYFQLVGFFLTLYLIFQILYIFSGQFDAAADSQILMLLHFIQPLLEGFFLNISVCMVRLYKHYYPTLNSFCNISNSTF